MMLTTDGYKLSMAEAGYPLRRETFYYTHRRGGAQLWLIDTERAVRALLPKPAECTDAAWADLAHLGYPMGEGFRAAMDGRGGPLTVTSLPVGAWFLPGGVLGDGAVGGRVVARAAAPHVGVSRADRNARHDRSRGVDRSGALGQLRA
jgi:hypothetical protein